MAQNINKSAGFAAGTLVHTEKGLVPIQDIQVGDMVLSKPRNGEGKLAYKPVIEKFVSKNEEIWVLTYFHPIPKNGAFYEEKLLTSAGHPIWISEYENDIGESHIVNDWMRVDELHNVEAMSILFDNKIIGLTANPVLTTPDANIGFTVEELHWDPDFIVEFNHEQSIIYGVEHLTGGNSATSHNPDIGEAPYNVDSIKIGNENDISVSKFLNYYSNNQLEGYNSRYNANVYNFKVTDSYTYFVEEKGLLVNCANCGYEQVNT